MGVDTKGFVITPVKDALLVVELIRGALDSLIHEEAQIRLPGLRPWDPKRKEQFRDVEAVICHSGTVQLHFTFLGHQRTMSLHFDCDCDQLEYGPESVSFSLGCSGESELFVTAAAFSLCGLGPAYVDHNDSDSIDPQLLSETPLSIASAIRLGYASVLSLPQWARAASRAGYSADQVATLLGVSQELARYDVLHGMSYEVLKDLTLKAPSRAPRFLEDYHQRAMAEVA